MSRRVESLRWVGALGALMSMASQVEDGWRVGVVIVAPALPILALVVPLRCVQRRWTIGRLAAFAAASSPCIACGERRTGPAATCTRCGWRPAGPRTTTLGVRPVDGALGGAALAAVLCAALVNGLCAGLGLEPTAAVIASSVCVLAVALVGHAGAVRRAPVHVQHAWNVQGVLRWSTATFPADGSDAPSHGREVWDTGLESISVESLAVEPEPSRARRVLAVLLADAEGAERAAVLRQHALTWATDASSPPPTRAVGGGAYRTEVSREHATRRDTASAWVVSCREAPFGNALGAAGVWPSRLGLDALADLPEPHLSEVLRSLDDAAATSDALDALDARARIDPPAHYARVLVAMREAASEDACS